MGSTADEQPFQELEEVSFGGKRPSLTSRGSLQEVVQKKMHTNWHRARPVLERPKHRSEVPSQVCLLDAHDGQPIRDVTVDLPGKRIATASGRDVRVWDYEDLANNEKPQKREIRKAHRNQILTVYWGANNLIATGSKDRAVKIWDGETLEPVWEFKNAHDNHVRHVEFSPDGTFLVSTGDDGRVRCYMSDPSWQHWRDIWVVDEAHTSPCTGVTFHPDFPIFITVGNDRMIKEFYLEKQSNGEQERRKMENAHTEWINTVAASPKRYKTDREGEFDYRFVTGSWDRSIKVWEWDTFECIRSLPAAHFTYPTCVVHLGDVFVSVSANKTVKMWSDISMECQHVVKHAHQSYISAAAVVGVSAVATVTNDSSLKIWSTHSTPVGNDVMSPASRSIRGFCVQPGEEDTVLLASKDFMTVYTDARVSLEGTAIEQVDDSQDQDDNDLTSRWCRWCSNSWSCCCCGNQSESDEEGEGRGDGPQIGRFLYYPGEKHVGVTRELTGTEYTVSAVAFGKKFILIAGKDHITFRDPTEERSNPTGLKKFEGLASPVRCLDFFSDYSHFVGASEDLRIAVWSADIDDEYNDISTPVLTQQQSHKGRIRGVAAHGDAKECRIVSVGDDRCIKIWGASVVDEKFEHLKTIEHSRALTAVAFCPLGISFAVASKSRTVTLYRNAKNDTETFPPIGFINNAQPQLMHAAFLAYTNNGRSLFSVDQFGGVRRWPLNLTPTVCRTVSSQFQQDSLSIIKKTVKHLKESKRSDTSIVAKEMFQDVEFLHGEIIRGGKHSSTERALRPSRDREFQSEPHSKRLAPTIFALRVPELQPKRKISTQSHLCFGPGSYAEEIAELVSELEGRDLLLFLFRWLPWMLTGHALGSLTLMHHAIRTKDIVLMDCVLSALKETHNHYILPRDESGQDPLLYSINSFTDDCTERLLDYIAENQGEQPVGTQVSAEHLKKLLALRPAVVAPFLKKLGMARVAKVVVGDVDTVDMKPEAQLLPSKFLDPHALWPKWEKKEVIERNKKLKSTTQQDNDEIDYEAQEHARNLKEYQVRAGVIGITDFSRDLDLLQMLVQSPYCNSLLNTEVVTHLVAFKWKSYGKSLYIWEARLFFVYLIMFCAFLILSTFIHDTQGNIRPACAIVSIVLGCITPIFTVRLALREYHQFSKNGWRVYFGDFWNIIDLMLLCFAFVSPPLMVVSNASTQRHLFADISQSIAAITVAFMWFKLLFFGRAFRAFGALIRMLFEIVDGMRTFLVVLAVAMIGFGMSFFVLLHKEKESAFANPLSTVVSCYTMMLGDFDLDVFGGNYVAIVLFILYMFIVFLIMLNVVIAIIGDTYDEVVQKQEVTFKRELATIFVEMEQFIEFVDEDEMEQYFEFNPEAREGLLLRLWHAFTRFMWSKSVRSKSDDNPAWLHVLSPIIKEKDETEEWQGRVQVISKSVQAQLIQLEEDIHNKHDRLEETLDSALSRLEERIDRT